MVGVTIKPFHPDDQHAARTLILNGLEEHWGFLDESKNPDLVDISSTYAQGAFLVAWIEGNIVGTGAYLPQSESVVEIVRMSVAKGMRRHGIGNQILAKLCRLARRNGYKKAILETTRTWQEVISFYQSSGFNLTHHVGEDAYFSKDL